jgi:sugar/nucleoside kinase (ribokinase family)
MSSSSPPSEEEEVILVIGACALDRLLTVATYPSPDAKVRTTSYHEMGGGNAANTAAAMGFLKDASFLSNRKIRIRLLTKVGDDAVGRQLKDELEDSGVDTSSPLFQMTHQTCTSFGTIIVDQETHTRTCLFTCGSCGELTLKETDELVDVDHVFQNVVWVHSDSRHTAVSLWLAQHAKTRNIPVSCDSEKDRNTKELDQLLEISNVLFTNSGYMAPYLDRLESEYSEFNKRPALVDPKVRVEGGLLKLDTIDMYCKSLTPAVFYDRWHDPFGKEVIVTQ